MKSLKANNEALSLAYKTSGHGGEAKINKDGPEGKLEEMADTYAKANNVPFAKAYKAVINTPEGKQLYADSLN